MDQDSQTEPGPSNGHLGTAWEIALVVVFVFVICAIVCTMIFLRRRRLRRERAQELDSEQSQQEKDPAENHGRTASFSNDDRVSISRPEPAASSHRPSRGASPSQSQSDQRIHRPPRYYWDTRR